MSRVRRGHTHAHTPRRVARGSRLQRGRRGWLLENRASPPRKCAAGPPAARSRWCGMGGPSAAPPLVGGAKRDTVPGVFWKGRSIPPPHSGCCATRGGGPNTGSHKVLCRPTPTRQTHPALGVEGGGRPRGLWQSGRRRATVAATISLLTAKSAPKKSRVTAGGRQRAAGRHSLGQRRGAGHDCRAPGQVGEVVAISSGASDGGTRPGRVGFRFVVAGEGIDPARQGASSRAPATPKAC